MKRCMQDIILTLRRTCTKNVQEGGGGGGEEGVRGEDECDIRVFLTILKEGLQLFCS